ncbi:glycosyltransferase, partial [bacterium]
RRHAGTLSYEVLAAAAGAGRPAEEGLRTLADRWPQLRLPSVPRGVSYPHTLNRILRAARGAHLLVLTDDVRVGPGCLEALLGAARSRPDAGAVTPRGHDACLLVPREAFLRIGEFDERFRGACWDADFRLRALQRGFHIVPVAGAALRRAAAPGAAGASADHRILFEKWAGHPLLPAAGRR